MAERAYTRRPLGLGEAFRRAEPSRDHNNSFIPHPTHTPGRSTPSLADSESDSGSFRGSPSPAPHSNRNSERIARAIAGPPRFLGRRRGYANGDEGVNGSPGGADANGVDVNGESPVPSVFAQRRRILGPRVAETTRTLVRKTSGGFPKQEMAVAPPVAIEEEEEYQQEYPRREEEEIRDSPINLTKAWKQETSDEHILDPPVHVPRQWGQRAKKRSGAWMKNILSPDPTLNRDFGMDLDLGGLRGGGYVEEGDEVSLRDVDVTSSSLPEPLPSRFDNVEGPRYPLKERQTNVEDLLNDLEGPVDDIPEARTTRTDGSSRRTRAPLQEMDFDVSQSLPPPPRETESEMRRRKARELRRARENAAPANEEVLPRKELVIDRNSTAERRRERREALGLGPRRRDREEAKNEESEAPRRRERPSNSGVEWSRSEQSNSLESESSRRRERAKASEVDASRSEQSNTLDPASSRRREPAKGSHISREQPNSLETKVSSRRERENASDLSRGKSNGLDSEFPTRERDKESEAELPRRRREKDVDSEAPRERVNGLSHDASRKREISKDPESRSPKRERPSERERDIPRSTTPEYEPNVVTESAKQPNIPDTPNLVPATPQPEVSPEKTHIWNADLDFTAHSLMMNDSPVLRQRNLGLNLDLDTETSRPHSEVDPEDRIAAEVSLFELQDHKSENNSVKGISGSPSRVQSPEPEIKQESPKPKHETPIAPKIDPLTLPTPRVTGAYIETPAPTIRKSRRPRSSSLTDLPSENSATFDLTTKETKTKTDAQATLKPRLLSKIPFKRKPLINSAILPSASEDLRRLQLEGEFEDCTLEELDKLLVESEDPNFKLEDGERDEMCIDLFDETGRRLTRKEKERRLEELSLERMERKLQKTSRGLMEAKMGIERIESTVSSSWTPAIITTQPRTSTDTTVYLQIPAPRLWYHAPTKSWRSWRFTWLGAFLALFLGWYLAESVMCEVFCHPTEATHNNWSVSDPFFPWAIPTKVDQWTGRVVSRWLGYREVGLW